MARDGGKGILGRENYPKQARKQEGSGHAAGMVSGASWLEHRFRDYREIIPIARWNWVMESISTPDKGPCSALGRLGRVRENSRWREQ